MDHKIEYLWKGIKDGDERSLKSLFEMCYPSMCYLSVQITHDRHLSEEIVQDVFLKLWKERKNIAIKISFKSYLYQVVRNYSINEVNKKKTLKDSVNHTASYGLWNYIIDHKASQDFIVNHIESVEIEKTIEKAVNSLPNMCRSVFQLSRVEYRSNKEIAKLMKISVNTVRAHIFHALEKISLVLHKEYKNP